MCVPSLNEIHESVFELSHTKVKTFGGGVMEVKPVYPRLSSGDIMKGIQTELLGFYALIMKITEFYQMFPELVTFPPNARLMQNQSIFSKANPQIEGGDV